MSHSFDCNIIAGVWLGLLLDLTCRWVSQHIPSCLSQRETVVRGPLVRNISLASSQSPAFLRLGLLVTFSFRWGLNNRGGVSGVHAPVGPGTQCTRTRSCLGQVATVHARTQFHVTGKPRASCWLPCVRRTRAERVSFSEVFSRQKNQPTHQCATPTAPRSKTSCSRSNPCYGRRRVPNVAILVAVEHT